MEILRSEHWRSISYCCGWGWRESRGPNPLLQAKLGGLRMVPVPWLTSSKPAQMSWSPSNTHPSHTQASPLSSSNSLLTPQPKQSTRWYLLSWEHSSSLFELVSLVSHLLCSTSFSHSRVSLSTCWSCGDPVSVSAVLWHQVWSNFWMTLAWKLVCHSQYSSALWT